MRYETQEFRDRISAEVLAAHPEIEAAFQIEPKNEDDEAKMGEAILELNALVVERLFELGVWP